MHKIGLKLWSTNTDYYIKDAERLFNDNVFDYIELYVVPDTLANIEKWKALNIPYDIHATHSAFGVNLSIREKKEFNYNNYLQVKKYADALKTDVIVYHCGTNGDYKETAEQLMSFDDDRILIENKPYKPITKNNDCYCVGTKYEHLKYIIDTAHCGFCLDIGHAICAANYYKIDYINFISKLVSLNPTRIHLSDIHIGSVYDEHLHFGFGELDFKIILKLLPKDINITIETTKNSIYNLNDFILDSKIIKDIN